jgi:hypothetical protein
MSHKNVVEMGGIRMYKPEFGAIVRLLGLKNKQPDNY